MRFVMIFIALAACTAQPYEPGPSGFGGGGGGNPPLTCAPDPMPARSTLLAFGGRLWTHESTSVKAGWIQGCSGLVECPWLGTGDAAVYKTCHIPGIASSVTAADTTIAKQSTTDVDRRYDTYTITTAHAGSVALHVTLTNTDTGETESKDATLDVRDLEDLRFRCIVGPDFYGATPQPCPDPIPAGTMIGVVIDGRTLGHYDYVAPSMTHTGDDQLQWDGCSGDTLAGDDHYSTFCIIENATKPITITASAFGVTRSYALSIQ